jgi:leucyl-tRNA synthetase
VNGKLRDTIEVKPESGGNKQEIEKLAGASENVKRHILDKKIFKVIFVPGKLINFVI